MGMFDVAHCVLCTYFVRFMLLMKLLLYSSEVKISYTDLVNVHSGKDCPGKAIFITLPHDNLQIKSFTS